MLKTEKDESHWAPSLADKAKIWIYQSDRAFTENELRELRSMLADFVTEWTSHTRKVIAEGAVLYDRFIALAADESAFQVSGCSIDSSVQFIKEIEKKFGVRLFDRHTVAYRLNDEIKTASPAEFSKLIEAGAIQPETIVFNNLVNALGEWQQKWEVPFSKSWHSKYFQKV